MAKQSEFEQLQEKYYAGIALVMLGKQSKELKVTQELIKTGFTLINESQGKLLTTYFDDFCGTHPKFPWPGGPFGPGPDPGPIKLLLGAEILGKIERLKTEMISVDLNSKIGGIASYTMNILIEKV
ncbi:hypothetical protein [Dyadobacter sp. 3J3]|uniref:hypothetical protein n=1 Tax=Dyadobacter sp. 3J3 TaxID=2606600 RepID=UPI00135AAA63|nr:hypothetical protein [Dyadobacter sp. 3J3]